MDVPDSDTLLQEETEDNGGGLIWIVLFGWVMVVSLVANLGLTGLAIRARRLSNPVYLAHAALFIINLVEYGALTFELSLGIEHHFPYSTTACSVYQTTSKVGPVAQAWVVVALLHYTAAFYCRTSSNSTSRNGATNQCSLKRTRLCQWVIFGVITTVSLAVIIPPAIFAWVVRRDNQLICEIDVLSTLDRANAYQNREQVSTVSVFYLAYSAILPYWLPLMVCLLPLRKLLNSRSGHSGSSARTSSSLSSPLPVGKYPEVDIALSTGMSYFVFFAGHGVIVLVRHSLDLVNSAAASGHNHALERGGDVTTRIAIDDYHSKEIRVCQSLLWLVAYFWHFARPTLVIAMDQDLKRSSGEGGGGGGKCCILFSPNHTYGSDSEDEEAHMQQLQLQTSSKHLHAKRAVSPSTFSQAKSESKISAFTLSSKDTSNTTIQRSPSQEYTLSSQLITEPEKSINSFYNNNETMTSSGVRRIINDGPVLSESHKLLNSVA